ncbi:MAG: radical SAM family heme chaperone HemW, partial [Acholeplasmataceae bacterium]
MKGLYVHIPFCESICHYCDFVKRVPKNNQMIDDYLQALVREIASYEAHFDTIDTIYIGGGTPSMLSVDQLAFLFESLKPIRPVEYTIEVNPESYTKAKGDLFVRYGINRVSLGVQTFHGGLLQYLNRKHTEQMVIDTVQHLKTLNLPHISIDLIYAIPGQTMADLDTALNKAVALDIGHVSCYSLILEEKTAFYQQFLQHRFQPLEEDLEAEMYQHVSKTLTRHGFEHYEISNFARPGQQSRHNLLYWSLGEYIGTGLGAHGFIGGHRTQNQRLFKDYVNQPLAASVKQTSADLLSDAMIFGLRKIEGVSLQMIKDVHG